jgi:hypothetical protein
MLPQRALSGTEKYFFKLWVAKMHVSQGQWIARVHGNALAPGKLPFNMRTWSQGGLRYFVIGGASTTDLDSLAKLFKAASQIWRS